VIETTGNTGLWPTMCGALTGEHLYVELSPTATDSMTLTLTLATTPVPATAQRVYDFQASQIPCYASYRAPNGCHRYYMEETGKITSLNFYKVSASVPGANLQNSGLELASQRLNTCIRRAKGMCCVEYQVCVVDTQGIDLVQATGYTGVAAAEENDGSEAVWNEGFSVDIDMTPFVIEETQTNSGLFDALCYGDSVEIPSSYSGSCMGGRGPAGNVVNSRYCGSKFGGVLQSVTAAVASSPVCDCSEPFTVRHMSDNANDNGLSGGVNVAEPNEGLVSRGFCLDYLQMPCYF
jgi:hypothetical protein